HWDNSFRTRQCLQKTHVAQIYNECIDGFFGQLRWDSCIFGGIDQRSSWRELRPDELLIQGVEGLDAFNCKRNLGFGFVSGWDVIVYGLRAILRQLNKFCLVATFRQPVLARVCDELSACPTLRRLFQMIEQRDSAHLLSTAELEY